MLLTANPSDAALWLRPPFNLALATTPYVPDVAPAAPPEFVPFVMATARPTQLRGQPPSYKYPANALDI